MNRLNKILLTIIAILVVALISMTYFFFQMKKTAEYNFTMYKNMEEQVEFLRSQYEKQ